MATPGELLEVLSMETGAPHASIFQHDRNLIGEGLRSKNGRGTNAARVTARDAAHLLVAIMGSDKIKNSVRVVKSYSKTILHEGTWDECGVPELTALTHGHSFVDALEALINAAMRGSLRAFMNAPAADDTAARQRVLFPEESQIAVSAHQPKIVGEFSFRSSRSIRTSYRLELPRDFAGNVDWIRASALFGEEALNPYAGGDLQLASTITARTLIAVAETLAADVATASEAA